VISEGEREHSAHTVRFAAANPSSGGHVADISATSVRMIPEGFRGRAEASAKAHPLAKNPRQWLGVRAGVVFSATNFVCR